MTRLAPAAPLVAAVLATGGCGARTELGVIERGEERVPENPPRGPTAIPEDPQQARADRIDLLFVIDDSGSMRDKQQILARALPDLVDRLINPLCVEPGTLTPSSRQPASPLDPCPEGTLREFNSVQDLHVGVISSSLGGAGAATCGPGVSASANDGARLLYRGIETYQDLGFIAWDPGRTKSPAGETDLESFRSSIERLLDVGESGCPYEMPLEALYRFLIDPEPYDRIEFEDCRRGSGLRDCALPVGVDEELLAERRAFLRPDSLVAIIVLSDENDCSIVPEGLGYLWFEPPGTMPRASSACADDPDDPCCRPCSAETPPGCVPASLDPECLKGVYPAQEEGGYLRCVDPKRRFGMDVRHPVSRYVAGLRGERVPRRDGSLADNPLFTDPEGVLPPRDSSLVFTAAIVGVPWQDLAEDPRDAEHLVFKTASQMTADGTWDLIVGDPTSGVLPLDPFMVESVSERRGRNPVTGDEIAPASESNPFANAINGHEATLDYAGFSVQSACVFDLPNPVNSFECNGFGTALNQAVCQAPDGSYDGRQYRGAAFPGLRELEVLRGLGDNAIVGSICARNVSDATRGDFGYRPALRAILDRLRVGLH